jgi:hypothetical protein
MVFKNELKKYKPQVVMRQLFQFSTEVGGSDQVWTWDLSIAKPACVLCNMDTDEQMDISNLF